MDEDRTRLEFFVQTWVEAVEGGEDILEESGNLMPEEDWNWVRAEVRRRIQRRNGREVG
jgi:hypothetical protein